MVTCDAKFIDTINRSKTVNCRYNLSAVLLKVIKWYTREIITKLVKLLQNAREIISLFYSSPFDYSYEFASGSSGELI